MILNNALRELVKHFSGNTAVIPARIVLGTDNTAVSETQTALISPIATTDKAFESSPLTSEYKVTFEHLLTEAEGNSLDFREVGLLGTGAVGTVTFSRNINPVVNKTSDETLQTIIVVEFLNEQ